MKDCIIALLFISSLSLSVTYSQTDWSGGSGVVGPVTDWGSEFSQQTLMDWSTAGQLTLERIFSGSSFLTGASVFQGCGSVTAVCVADFSGDGLDDIAGGFWDTGFVSVAINTGAGTSWQIVQVDGQADQPVMLAKADFDGDGDVDLALSEAETGSILWYSNEGSGTSWEEHTIGSCPGAYACISWDPDADGDCDILCTSRTEDWIGWFENATGTGTEWILHVMDDQFDRPLVAAVGNMNADGLPDVAVSGEGGIKLAIYLSPEYNRVNLATDTLDMDLLDLALADLNGNGLDDIAAGAVYWPGVLCFLNPASGSPIYSTSVSWCNSSSLFSCDLDLDEDNDLVSSSFSNDVLLLMENTDAGLIWAQIPHPGIGITGFFRMASGDFNGDGSSDLAGASYLGEALLTMICQDVDFYYPSGVLISSIIQIDNSSDNPWFISINGDSEITMNFRSANSLSLGPWSNTLTVSPGQWVPLYGIEADDQYFQYKVGLDSLFSSSPVLEEVLLSNSPTGISGDPQVPTQLLRPVANPARGTIEMILQQPEDGPVSVSVTVFDIYGRIHDSILEDCYSKGEHSLQSEELPVGCYTIFYRIGAHAGSFRVVILD